MLGVTLTTAAWVAGAQVHRRHAAARALDQYAQSRGLHFVPAPPKPRGASPRVIGIQDGVEYVIDLYRLGADIRTRVTAVSARGRAPHLSVAQHGAFRWSKAVVPRVLRVGDGAFDAAYLVTTGVAEDAEALRMTVGSLLVLNEREGVWLASDGHKVGVSWRGVEADPRMLDAARDATVTVATWDRPATPYR